MMNAEPAGSEARNIRLVLAYDGTGFLGWQRQPQGPTIQAALEDALTRITGAGTLVKGSGRTDAGVHALGQVANFHTNSRMGPDAFRRALNGVLPRSIAVLHADVVPDDFDAQFSAVGKIYRYRVLNSRDRDPFERRRSWLVHRPLDVEKISAASMILLGKKDFSSFRASGCTAPGPVRVIRRCDVARSGDMISIELEADGFLRHMVRNIVGTLVEVGIGRFSTAAFADITASCDRTAAGITAPPHGLYLVRVLYPPLSTEPSGSLSPGVRDGALDLTNVLEIKRIGALTEPERT